MTKAEMHELNDDQVKLADKMAVDITTYILDNKVNLSTFPDRIRELILPQLISHDAELIQKWLDTEMKCGHPQRYRAGIAGKTDTEWMTIECDECLVCERAEFTERVREVERNRIRTELEGLASQFEGIAADIRKLAKRKEVPSGR